MLRLAVVLSIVTGLFASPTAAQFRSFSAMQPTISDEIDLVTGMESPAGQYAVRDARAAARTHTYQVDRCHEMRPTPALTRELAGDRFVRCRVLEINISLECDRCSPQVLTWEDVVFARSTSTLLDESQQPVTDNWVAYLSLGMRRFRLIIERARFIVHDWSVADPNMAILEAPIRRASAR